MLEVLHILVSKESFSKGYLPRLLHMLPAPSRLRRLLFEITFSAEKPGLNVFDWLRDLDAELEREDFHDLMEVVFDFSIHRRFTSEEQIVEVIEGNMPKLSSRSPPILRIDVTVFWDPEDEVAPDADISSDASSEWESDSQTSDETSD